MKTIRLAFLVLLTGLALVSLFAVDPAQAGAFGLAFTQPRQEFVRFAAVDDNTNAVTVWKVPFENGGQ